ncbi:histidine kinase [Deminuibacter soli]|nr:histidine kinase [Deminuibacter soli]
MRLFFITLLVCVCQYATARQQPATKAGTDTLIAQARRQLLQHTGAAMKQLQQAAAIAEELEYTSALADARYLESKLQTEIGNFPEAETAAREAFELNEQLGRHREVLDALNCLAFALYAQSRFTEGEKVYRALISTAAANPADIEGARIAATATSMLGCMFQEMGNYGKAFEYCNEGLQRSIRAKDSVGTVYALVIFGELYNTIDDIDAAMDFFRQAEEQRRKYHVSQKAPYLYMGNVYFKRGMYDSAVACYQEQLHHIDTMQVDSLLKLRYAMFPKTDMAQILLTQGQHAQAMEMLLTAYQFFKHGQDNNQVLKTLQLLGQASLDINRPQDALQYGRESIDLAMRTGAAQYLRDGNALLWHAYHSTGNTDSAYVYLTRYTALNNSIDVEQSARKLAFYKASIKNQENEARICQLEQQRETNNMRINMLLAGIGALLLLGFVVLRNNMLKRRNEHIRREQLEQELQLQKTESERQQAAFEKHTAELKMRALHAQMNPHFIFNSLNSINRFILKNETETAADYLTKFSRLIRLVLQNGDKNQITLAEELEMLDIYLKLEQVRFGDRFSYHIECEEALNADMLYTPPMLIQPFVENAIWHGLLHKPTRGLVTIHLYSEGDYLCCRITDDGIGRAKAAELKSKSANNRKSFGMRITSERLGLLQQQRKEKVTLEVTDLVDSYGEACGTEILIKLPVEQPFPILPD